ncbi:hypothetical protein ANN_25904 [Periplaneta americana]|uniref:Histone-lysine N-methyltransferase SETMAR n=1 Tax=Periplaneta americana TaxID=6978 RepID=A0ABQ8S582_PERAM|nr:hypothetical protein ANN_25904 [Periplaneta americana]
MQLTLLQDLLYLTMEKDVDVSTHKELDLAACPRHVLFAVTLYHRPGLQDPTYVPQNVSEELVRGLESQVSNSIAVLSRVVSLNTVPTVPVFETFVMLTEDSTDARQNWDKSAQVSGTEFFCQLHFDLGSFHFFREEYPLSGEYISKAAQLKQQLGSEASVYCTVSNEDLQGYSEACDITAPTASSHNLTYQLHRAIRDQYTGIVSILQADNLRQEIPQVYRDTLELDIQGAMSSRKFTVARDLLLQVQTLNVVRRVVAGTLTCGDYVHRLGQGGSKAIDILLNALKHVLANPNDIEKERIKLFVLQLVECGDVDGLPERFLSCGYLVELFSPRELEEVTRKTAAVGRDDAMDIPELLLKTNWDMPDFAACKNSRLEVGNLEQQLILSYNATEIRGLVEKLVTANPAKPQWRINNKDFKLAAELLTAVEQEARSSSVSSGVMYKLVRLLSWETLLIQIIEFLTDWPNHKLTARTHTRTTLSHFLSRLRDSTALAVVISLLARLHNMLRDEPSLELSVDYSGLWPASVSKYYLEAAIVVSDFFSQPIPRAAIDDHVYRRMIKCCTHLQCHTQAAVLCQFLEEVDYTTAFKSLGDIKSSTCSDAMDSYYSCIWDTTILEYLVHLHTKRGEHHRKQQAIKVIGLLELNANNNEEIQREAANIRKSRFLRAMARQSRLVPVAWQQWSEMEALIPSPAACEVRSVIKFFTAQSFAPIEIHRQLCQVYGPNIMSKQMVRRWCRQFSEGRQSVHDEERSGRPSLINDDSVELVRQRIMENRHFTITELSSLFPQISRSLLHRLSLSTCCSKRAALTFLQWYHDDGDEFLDRIVTGDETWISHFIPETKQQSMHWRHSGSPVRTKFKQSLLVRKVMCTVFWDRKGILLIDFLPRCEIVNADRYYETLRKLRCVIQNKRRGMLTAGVVLLHDNARPHTARRTAGVLTEFGWELFDHPPYSPDLAPSDFHVFLHLKKFLSSGERFGHDEELKTSVTRWFHSQTAEFYDRGIQKLIAQYDKCLNSDGGYVEK